MNRPLSFVALSVLACLVLSWLVFLIPDNPALAQPADSPWPMFGGNPQRTGQSPYSGPRTPDLKWVYTTGDHVASSPALGADGTIYIGSTITDCTPCAGTALSYGGSVPAAWSGPLRP